MQQPLAQRNTDDKAQQQNSPKKIIQDQKNILGGSDQAGKQQKSDPKTAQEEMILKTPKEDAPHSKPEIFSIPISSLDIGGSAGENNFTMRALKVGDYYNIFIPENIRDDERGSGLLESNRGDRKHNGVDYNVNPGATFVSPFDKMILKRKISAVYPEGEYKNKNFQGFVALVEKDGVTHEVKVLYADMHPDLQAKFDSAIAQKKENGESVDMSDLTNLNIEIQKGDPMGIAQDVREEHGDDMTPHIHLQVKSEQDNKYYHPNILFSP